MRAGRPAVVLDAEGAAWDRVVVSDAERRRDRRRAGFAAARTRPRAGSPGHRLASRARPARTVPGGRRTAPRPGPTGPPLAERSATGRRRRAWCGPSAAPTTAYPLRPERLTVYMAASAALQGLPGTHRREQLEGATPTDIGDPAVGPVGRHLVPDRQHELAGHGLGRPGVAVAAGRRRTRPRPAGPPGPGRAGAGAG